MLIWVVDDNQENLAMIERSFAAVRQVVSLRSFTAADAFLAALRDALADSGSCWSLSPDFILLDFFLQPTYGHLVLAEIDALYAAAGVADRAVVIAHSSQDYASQLMLGCGADFILPKVKGQATSPALERAFSSSAAIAWMRRERRLPAGLALDDLGQAPA